MPIKLGLVIERKQNTAQLFTNTQELKTTIQDRRVNDAQNGISLRRVITAPKTGCKSCGG